jgi:hypothetical protein
MVDVDEFAQSLIGVRLIDARIRAQKEGFVIRVERDDQEMHIEKFKRDVSWNWRRVNVEVDKGVVTKITRTG